MAHLLKPRLINKLEEELGATHEYAINRVYAQTQKGLITDGEHQGLWGLKDNQGITYELYYTERVLEALTEFIIYYKQADVSIFRSVLQKDYSKKSSKRVEEIKTKRSSEKKPLPKREDKYTSWIPELAKGVVPSDLKEFAEWRADHMLEFYIFQLFHSLFKLEGTQWGYKKIGKPWPDGRITMFSNGNQFIYDAKSTGKDYKLDIDEERKFEEYYKTCQKLAESSGKTVQYFVVIAPSFKGNLTTRGQQFRSKTGVNLVCMMAKDVCKLANQTLEKTMSTSAIRLFEWHSLFAKGKPELSWSDYDKTFQDWVEKLESRSDL